MKTLTQGQRKTLMFLTTLASLTSLCWFGKLDGAIAATNIVFSLGIGVGGNALEHMSKRGATS